MCIIQDLCKYRSYTFNCKSCNEIYDIRLYWFQEDVIDIVLNGSEISKVYRTGIMIPRSQETTRYIQSYVKPRYTLTLNDTNLIFCVPLEHILCEMQVNFLKIFTKFYHPSRESTTKSSSTQYHLN